MRQTTTILACGLIFFLAGSLRSPAGAEQAFDGLIEPSETVRISSQVPGILASIQVERGDRVDKGAIVARLDSKVETAAVELALARKDFARRKVQRNEELYRKNLISVHDNDEMETELRIADLQLREAREKLEIRIIRSPIDGIVAERLLSPGEYVGEEPILELVRLDPLYVEVFVPVAYFGKIKSGMGARVTPEFPDPRTHRARVVIVDRIIDAASGTFGVRLELPNPGYALPAGLKCRVAFPVHD